MLFLFLPLLGRLRLDDCGDSAASRGLILDEDDASGEGAISRRCSCELLSSPLLEVCGSDIAFSFARERTPNLRRLIALLDVDRAGGPGIPELRLRLLS